MSHARTPPRPNAPLWGFVSLGLHALLVFGLVQRVPARAALEHAPAVWVEAVVPEPPKPPPVEKPPEPPPPPPPVKTARTPAKASAKSVAEVTEEAPAPAPGPVIPDLPPLGVEPGEGTLAIETEGRGNGGGAQGTGTGTGPGTGTGIGKGSGKGGGPPPARVLGPAQLSLWMDPPKLVAMALTRPAIALLMAVPGYTDLLRGSGIQPLSDLQRLRISLAGLAPERLTLAGVHASGEPPLLAAAAQVAAMRNRQPVWRGDDALRATSWVDGSGVDRGLAVNKGAFVIAERGTLPDLLGDDDGGGTRVTGLSRLRDRIVLLLTLEDAAHYLPGVSRCGLQALRLSVADGADGHRLALTAYYGTAADAGQAGSCLPALDAGRTQLPGLLAWLARAEAAPNSFSTKLTTGVTSDDIQRLFDELAWALRSARRG